MTVEIRALQRHDDRRSFESGDDGLDLYFRRYAGQNQFRHHVGATYVAVDENEILAFVTVAAGSLDAPTLPEGEKLPPYPVPVLRVARLAVATRQQGRGLGEALLRFSIELAETMRDAVGCVGLVVDAKPQAVAFYERYGFITVHAERGQAHVRPAATLMFLSLRTVPKRRA
jgi:GNAT superfamily N-acetyltransferase